MKNFVKYSNLVLVLFLLVGCVTSPTGRKQFMIVSPERAIAESQRAYITAVQEFDEEGQLLNDPVLADRVAVITGRLVTEAITLFPHVRDWEWSVALIDEPETINAWCMAGGRMAVYSGLFEELKLTDDEFAQIMGHEISHALANHTAERMSVAMMAGIASTIAEITSPDKPKVLLGVDLLAMLGMELPNSRTSEKEADQMGTELATLAGYEPSAVLSLWRKMEETDDSRLPDFLSTHPSPANRREKLAAMVQELELIKPSVLSDVHPVNMIYDRDASLLPDWLRDW